MSEGPKHENPAKTPRRYTPADAAQDSKNVPLTEEKDDDRKDPGGDAGPEPVKQPKP